VGLRYYSNTASQAALAAAIGATDTAITFTAGTFTGYPTQFPYTASIARGTADEEIVLVTAASGNQVTVTRAYDGTTGKAHGAGATFTEVVIAQDYREANAHVNATAAAHGTASAVVGVDDAQTLTNKTLTDPAVTDGSFTGTQQIADAQVTTLTVTGVTTLAGFAASGAGSVAGLLTASGGVSVPTGKKVTLTDAPAAGTDAANKSYVDGKTWPTSAISDAAAAATPSVAVKRDGSGRAQFADPAAAADAATKGYVDAAVPGHWTALVTSATGYSTGLATGAFTALSGYGALSVTVPAGRELELEYTLPRLNTASNTSGEVRLVAGGAVLDTAYQFSATAALSDQKRLTGSVVGTGAAVSIAVEAQASGAGCSAQGTTSRGPQLRYRII
jgi:hypothetical protein